MTYECPRCAGKGTIAAHKNVLGGICFKCHGAGHVAQKPAAPSAKWACEYRGARLFTISAKTEAAALKAAVARINPAYPAFAGVTAADARVYPA